NTGSDNYTLSSGRVIEPGILLRIEGDIEFIGIVKAKGFLEIRYSSGNFVLKFDVTVNVANIADLHASGLAAVYTNDPGGHNGLVLALDVSIKASLLGVISLDAGGKFELNTTGITRDGVGPGFLLSLHGSLVVLDIMTFNASFLIK